MKRIIGNYSAHLSWIAILSIVGILFVFSCEQTTGPGDDKVEVSNKLLILTDKASIVANKGSVNISAKVYADDDTSKAMSGIKVKFTADNSATVQTVNDVTDTGGIARAILFAGSQEGKVKITATISNYSNAAYVTVTPDSGLIDTNLSMNLTSEPAVLPANGSDVSVIKAQLFDSEKNPVQGETIHFTTSLGIIQESATTDEWGVATVDLKSERFNGKATVTARYNQITRLTYVEFSGAVVKSQATPTVLVADNTSKAVLSISLSDASGSPVVDGLVSLSTTLGTLMSADGVSHGLSIVDSTSTQGKVTAYLTSDKDGEATITVSALGTLDSLTVQFTNYTFSLAAAESEIYAGGQKTTVNASLKDKDGAIKPISRDDVNFSTTLGTIVFSEIKTDGTAVAELTSGSSAGTATVTASIKNPPVSSSTTVNFIAASADSVFIQADRLSVKIGGEEVEIRATVYDVTGNPKSNETVTFSILKGPGGDEKITPPTAVTNSRGQAVVSFKSGNQGTSLDGVEIQARIGNIFSNIIKLTIAGEPYSVVVGFSASSFTTNPDGTHGIGVSAIVSDVNRNKVSDGTIVNFSLRGDVGVIEGRVPTKDGVASTTLIYASSDAGKEVEVIASSGGISNSKSVVLPGKAGTVATLSISPKESYVQADGISTVSLSIFLTDTNGEPLSNRTVYCETDLGVIQPSAITGDPSIPDSSPGKAVVSYTSIALRQDSVANVRIYSGEVEQKVKIYLKGITMSVTADPSELPSDGQSKSTIHVLIKEVSSDIPISGKEVRFGSTQGSIGGSATTDASGIATSTFTSGYAPGTAYIKVNYGATLVDSVAIIIKEVKARGIELFANPSQIPANGISTSIITALLRDDNYNPIVGENIIFSTTLGTISSSDTTDTQGRAEATLVSDRRNGEATVTAKFKQHVTTIPVNFTGVKINVSASPENLFAGGEEETVVSAYVKDAADVAIVGTDVKFAWYLDITKIGEKTVKTDVQGRASIAFASENSGKAKIVIEGAGAVDSTYVTFTRLRFTIGSDQDSVATGGDKLHLWAQLYDTVSEKNVEGVTVEFYTTLGTITQSDVTDAEGKAYADLVSANTAGSVTVSASTKYGNDRISTEKRFTYVNAQPDSVILRTDANIVGVGGGNSRLIAVVTDKYGNPVSDVLVSFKVLKGPAGGEEIRPPTVTTGSSGTASSFFYSGQLPSAFESVLIQAQVGAVQSNTVALTIAGAPETIRPGYKTGTDQTGLDNNDGTYSLPISALVLDVNSNGVVDGTTVYFKVEPPEGAVISPVKTVNSVAASKITYPAASAGRKVTLTASAGGKEGSISFTLPGFMVSYLSVSASPKSIPADGKSTCTIRATIFDISGSAASVPDGTTISFTTDGGTIDPFVATTVDGVATTTLTSDKNANRYVLVTAKSGTLQDYTSVLFAEVGTSVNQVSDIELSAEPSIIVADGLMESIITATLRMFDGSVITTPTTVSFTTDVGDIEKFTRSDEKGIATARFTSGVVGTANITATVGTVTGTTTIIIIPGPPQSVDLVFEPTSVGIQGSGRNETLLITAKVKDNKNNPVGDGNLVKFELVGTYDTNSSLSPSGATNHESEPVPTVNGAARVSFHAGTKSGAIRVKATVVTENGEPVSPPITSETTQFLVYAGPAYMDMTNLNDPFTNSRMRLYGGPLNIYAGAIGTNDNKSTITVVVADRNNNPVPEGTAVLFKTTGGTITTDTGFTDKNGMASVTLYSTNPFPTRLNSNTIANPNSNNPLTSLRTPASFDMPPYDSLKSYFDIDGDGLYNNGIAIVTAQTEGVNQNGNEVTVWNFVPIIFSLGVSTFEINTEPEILYNGETAIFEIVVHDVNGNPVVGGSEITFASAKGVLSTSKIVTNSPGEIRYTVSLTNNLDPEKDKAGNTVVTATLASPNGKATASDAIYLSLGTAP
ncbi:Ig-like domain-containing protein [bacterium]|nr:Ig-like domain-containing protein [bacterium]